MRKSILVCFYLTFLCGHLLTAQCWRDISPGFGTHTLAIYEDGTLWAWGNNNNGQLGDGTNENKLSPVQISAETNWKLVCAGALFSIGLKTDGTLWSWGHGGSGQLGDGTNTSRNFPAQIGTESNWLTVGTGKNFTIAIKSDGTLWSWGYNLQGQLGDGTDTQRNAPVQIGMDKDWKSIYVATDYTLALKTNGSLWGWGSNTLILDYGLPKYSNPIQIGVPGDNWKFLSPNREHVLGIKSDGTLWSWGKGGSGKLFNGSSQTIESPTHVMTDKLWKSVAAGDNFTVAVATDGTLWAAGSNTYGQIGDSTKTIKFIPIQIGMDSNWHHVVAQQYSVFAKKVYNSTLAWGCNFNGLLGNGKTSHVISPARLYCHYPYLIKGKCYLDFGYNNCESNSIPYPYSNILLDGGIINDYFSSDNSGSFYVRVPEGTWTIGPKIVVPVNHQVNPPSLTYTFPSSTDTINTQDFCITMDTLSLLEIAIIPVSPARPGFESKYKIVCKNNGTIIENGLIEFNYDASRTTFEKSKIAPIFQTDGVLRWEFNQLFPAQKWETEVTLKFNSPMDIPAVNIGDKFFFNANTGQNRASVEVTTVGSYDPNDKTCLQGESITPEMVGDFVEYLIRFENTGTYFAENIVVRDVIDTTVFDISTLQIIDASHAMYTRIHKGHIVEFVFDNIQLPFEDAFNDGYIAFRIKTRPTLQLGNELKNLADIYFDFNFPIRTNETATVIALPSSIQDIHQHTVRLLPNPVHDFLYVTLPAGSGPYTYEIFNIYGQSLISVHPGNDGDRIDVQSLSPGYYFFHVNQQGNRTSSAFVKH